MIQRIIFAITPHSGGKPFRLALKGRNAWAMRQLINAKALGCTPITRPAPRWSAYVFNLRKFGIDIKTIHERHEGEFAGSHARYVLKDEVREIGGWEQ